jgi:hypothetical protein
MKKNLYSTFLFAVFFCSSVLAQDNRVWATYYGGSGNENGISVATDASGNIYMAGTTGSINGIASNGFQNFFGGGNVDSYLAKFNASGSLLWATYYGGPGNEMTLLGGKIGIATDASGNVYLAGLTTSTSGIASGGFQNTIGGGVDAYLVKFDSSGNRMWGTYYGGTGVDYGYNVATDLSGNVYLTGVTGNAAGIASGGFQNTLGGLTDAFLVKFDAAGNRLWATYYGGTESDQGFSIVTDVSGNVYLAGAAASLSGIASAGFQNTFGGGSNDAFLVKFDSAGARIWATYYGGAGDEMMTFSSDIDIAVDASGVFLCGLSTSTSGIASGGFQNTFGGGAYDAFLVKFTNTGIRVWGTYYGGLGGDKGYAVTTDGAGNTYLSGHTTSDAAIASGGFQNIYGTNEDAFLVKFTTEGLRECATYYGGDDFDVSDGIAVDNDGNVYIPGNTASQYNIAANGFQNFFGGGQSDAFLVKFTSCATTGVNALEPYTSINIYPNPVKDKLNIKVNHSESLEIILYDITLRKVAEQKFNRATSLNTDQLVKGIYIYEVRNSTDLLQQGKIVKE